MIVVDTNVLAARNLTAAHTAKAEQVQRADPVWIVPVLWRYEFQNILATAIKARQLTLEDALTAWRRVAAAMAENESDPSPARVMDLVARHQITACDAQFVALAIDLGVVCVTEDRELQRKFPGLAVSMDAFLAAPA